MLAKKERGELPDHTLFLIKYIEYARQLKPTINEAENMLSNYATDIRIKGFGSDRILPRYTN